MASGDESGGKEKKKDPKPEVWAKLGAKKCPNLATFTTMSETGMSQFYRFSSISGVHGLCMRLRVWKI
jgi:hypothetical protein